MRTVTFTQLRNNARKYFDAVERGETLEIYRHGKPIAILSPVRLDARKRWKRMNPLEIKGASLSRLIRAERRAGL
jgi:prevent-host-death family protein